MATLRPKLIVSVGTIVIVFLLVSLIQEMNRRWQVQREVAALEADVRSAERKVVELEQLNQYFRTDAFQERLARENLNYSAPGETVVLIPEDAAATEVASSTANVREKPLSPHMEWWRIFFVHERPFEILHDEEAS